MNKQEAILRLKAESWEYEDNCFRTAHAIDLDVAQEIIFQILEPKKVTIPEFVAEWIEEAKAGGCSLCTAFGLVDGSDRAFSWLFDGHEINQETFARAWLDGYEIEKDKLYTVEIPNPALDNLEFVIVLKRIRGRVCLVNTYDYMGRELSDEYKLTESEIKQDFEWAWDAGFAKLVEVE
ncbi:TPA: DUF1642 domain-containing protein [Streptococcus suis]